MIEMKRKKPVINILHHHPAQVSPLPPACFFTIHPDHSPLHSSKSADGTQKGRFTGSVAAHDSDDLTGGGFKAKILLYDLIPVG